MSDVMGNSIVLTPSVIADQLVSNILTDQQQMAGLEQQVATGNRISQPSDDPAGTAAVLQLSASLDRAKQYVTNANDGLGWLQQGTSTVNQMVSVLQQVEQAVVSSTGQALTGSPAAVQALATQVQNAKSELIQLANTQYAGQAIFAGTGNVTKAYDQDGNYVGGGASPTVTIAPGTQVAIATTGPALLGSGPTGLLGVGGILDQIADDLQTGTAASIQQATTTGLSSLQDALSNVESQAAVLGANYQQMQQFSQQATQTQSALQTQLVSLQGADIPQAITQLSAVQNSFQQALWATSMISQTSLVQFLG